MIKENLPYILSGTKLADIIPGNPYTLLLLEHFEMDSVVQEKTTEQACLEAGINPGLFLKFANLFNGYTARDDGSLSVNDLPAIIKYLSNSHEYYLSEKYPEIKTYINNMFNQNELPGVNLVEKFFDEYFNEVIEHLDYENKIVFPYVSNLLQGIENISGADKPGEFSSSEYKDHHDNIEEKLNDLKNLLIKYLPCGSDRKIRRKLLFSLMELEFDLNIHSIIEDTVFIPLVEKLELQTGSEYGG